MSWFADWFNSPYYHILYKNRDETEAKNFIDYLANYLSLSSEHKILDLACGKGRHSIYLNSKGLDLVGVDLSSESIQIAKQSENDRLQFHTHDMREPVGTEEFDFVLNLFTSFGYFQNNEDDLRTLQSVNFSLKHKGKFVLDFFNAHKVIQNLVSEENKEIEGIRFNITKRIEDGFIIKEIKFSDLGKSYSFYEKVKALKIDNFKDYFVKANLNLTTVFGSYNLDEFDANISDRLILIAQKV